MLNCINLSPNKKNPIFYVFVCFHFIFIFLHVSLVNAIFLLKMETRIFSFLLLILSLFCCFPFCSVVKMINCFNFVEWKFVKKSSVEKRKKKNWREKHLIGKFVWWESASFPSSTRFSWIFGYLRGKVSWYILCWFKHFSFNNNNKQ